MRLPRFKPTVRSLMIWALIAAIWLYIFLQAGEYKRHPSAFVDSIGKNR